MHSVPRLRLHLILYHFFFSFLFLFFFFFSFRFMCTISEWVCSPWPDGWVLDPDRHQLGLTVCGHTKWLHYDTRIRVLSFKFIHSSHVGHHTCWNQYNVPHFAIICALMLLLSHPSYYHVQEFVDSFDQPSMHACTFYSRVTLIFTSWSHGSNNFVRKQAQISNTLFIINPSFLAYSYKWANNW